MSKIITNTSPIIALSTIGKLNLLWQLFDEVYVSEAVCNEILAGYPEHTRGKEELEKAIGEGNIKIYTVKDTLFVSKMVGKLHKGEVETIVGGLELNIDFVLIDERSARTQAKNSLLIPVGTIGILRIAKQRGIITEIKPYLTKLLQTGYRLSETLCNRVLKSEGEI
jgi:predicted nucleic acid-binding protein